MHKNNTKKGLGAVGIIIIIGVVILAAFYFYNLGTKNSQVEYTLEDIDTSVSTNTSQNNSTSNTQTQTSNTSSTTSTASNTTTSNTGSENPNNTESNTDTETQTETANGQEDESFDLRIVDSQTMFNVQNPSISINGTMFDSIENFLTYTSTATPGQYSMTFSASGYSPMTVSRSLPFAGTGLGINLDPVNSPYDCPTQGSVNSNEIKICGFIGDNERNPLSGVQISSPDLPGLLITTDQNGYFHTIQPLSTSFGCGTIFTLTYSKDGYTTINQQKEGIVAPGLSMSVRQNLTPGTGSENNIERHGTCS